MTSTQIQKSLTVIINNNFGNGQININLLNEFLKSKGRDELIDKMYTPDEIPTIHTNLNLFLHELILQGEYKSATIALNINSYRLKKNEFCILTSAPGINRKFFMRYRSTEEDNLKSLIQLYKPTNINENIDSLIVKVVKDTDEPDDAIRNLIKGSTLTIHTANDAIDATKRGAGTAIKLNNIMYDKLRSILKLISNSIKDIFNLNIAFWSYPNKGVSGKGPLMILPDIADIDNLIFFNVNLVWMQRKHSSRYDLYFNEIVLVNMNINKITKNITDKDILNLIIVKYGKPKEETVIESEVIEHINFNPFDKDIELPVIIINNDGKKQQYLLGNAPTYNLYLDNTNNDLVGCIRFTNKEDGLGTVYWCKEYKS